MNRTPDLEGGSFMEETMIKPLKTHLLIAAAIATTAIAASASATLPMLFEEQVAHAEEARILRAPIDGIQNHFWFDYRVNVVEAQKELASDLRHARSIRKQRHAWDEYGQQLRGERRHYIREMAERGHRYAVVTAEEE